MDPLDTFCGPVRRWFTDAFPAPTPVQARAWPILAGGGHALLLAPTGSGKTLAAFLASLDRLVRGEVAPRGYSVLYVSPLKALVVDIERNLRAPLIGIGHAASRAGEPCWPVRVDVRTGDTPAKERVRMARRPGDILVTTPESLYLMLGSEAREALRAVRTVIVDEIHVMAASKRGVHLALSLERLARLTPSDPQRVGLSATQRPLEEVARFLGGDREVAIVDTSEPPKLDLQICVPTPDMERPVGVVAAGAGGDGQRQVVGGGASAEARTAADGMWPVILPELLSLIRAHRSTLVFTNSRLLCERLAQRLNELAGAEIALAHHGSVSHEQRAVVEDRLKRGTIPAIVATSSLELGIDMGAVDLVVLVESPATVASGLQRVGRAGHQVGARSEGRIFPKFRGDLLVATVVAQRMLRGEVEATRVPRNCLDVLAQQIVAAVGMEDWPVGELGVWVRRAYPYRDLSESAFVGVLDMLSGKYPSEAFAELSPRLTWDRSADVLRARAGVRMLAALNGGTIADRGSYSVYRIGGGGKLGELDEEMVYETRKGDRIILGASTWKVEEIGRDRVLVSPAPGEPGRLPFWRGQRAGRPAEVGQAIGALLARLAAGEAPPSDLLDPWAVDNLVAYVQEQAEATGVVPTHEQVVVESFRDELGDWRVCVHSPLGARVMAAWGLALEAHFGGLGHDVQALWTDDGVCVRFVDADTLPPLDGLFPDPDEVEELVTQRLAGSALFAAHFRENASRALLLPKRRARGRTPLWQQRLKAQGLQQVAQGFPAFPIVLETYREVLQEQLDLPSLTQLLRAIAERRCRVHTVTTRQASPFARSLVFAYVAAFMYAGDAPAAERRALALALDREALADLLGRDELAARLDPSVAAALEAELQRTAVERRVASADAAHDLLRRVGDLSTEEVAARSTESPGPWLKALLVARRVVEVRIAGVARWIAVEDAALYRDGLGVVLPPSLPEAFLEPQEDALLRLIVRWAKTHAPFGVELLAGRWGLGEGPLAAILDGLVARGKLVRGLVGATWADAEVMRRVRQRNLARLRAEVAPVEAAAYGRFLSAWHGLIPAGARPSGPSRPLIDVVSQLQGVPLPASQLDALLARRARGYRADDLDTLGATGEVVWVGKGSAGPRDGRLALYKRDQVPLLLDAPTAPEGFFDGDVGAVRRALLDRLEQRGASFVVALHAAVGGRAEAVVEALWDLAWAGLVTNDTFSPIRQLARGTRTGSVLATVGGRWSAVAELLAPVDALPRAVARAATLLERHGVACAAAAKADGWTWSELYPVLREMEEAGKVRRGWFVDGLEGAQFAVAGVVDRLRSAREPSAEAVVVPVTDPANPWGRVLPWPASPGRPRRVVGGDVVLVDGAPALWADKGGRAWVTFGADEAEARAAAVAWVGSTARPSRVLVETIDGGFALQHAWAAWLEAVGFVRSYKGWAWGGASP